MEELRSTEILDREIQADAKRKADNILKKADKSCDEILNSVEKTIEDARKAKTDFYNKKLEAVKKNLDSSIPLEKQRLEVSFVQKSIIQNINKYLEGLSEDERMDLVLQDLGKKKLPSDGKKFTAYVYGFDAAKIKKKLSSALGKSLEKCEKTEFGRISIEDDYIEKKEGVLLESDDKSLRLRLTLSEVVKNLFENHRKELCDALFEGGLA